MGCAEHRSSPLTSSTSPSESLDFPIHNINDLTRRYAPNRYISQNQFQAIASELNLLPLSSDRRKFYDCIRRGEAYDRLEMLVAHIMFGKCDSESLRLELLFEVVDDAYAKEITVEQGQNLLRAMLRISISYYLRAQELEEKTRQQLLMIEAYLEPINRYIIRTVTGGEVVTRKDWVALSEKEHLRMCGVPEGLRKIAAAYVAESEAKRETEDGSDQMPASLPSQKKKRHRGEVSERGKEVSASIQAKSKQRMHRSLPT